MKLSAFLKQTIEEIAEGVETAREGVTKSGARLTLTDNSAAIEFDLAVSPREADRADITDGVYVCAPATTVAEAAPAPVRIKFTLSMTFLKGSSKAPPV